MIYINDICNAEIILFADYTNLFFSHLHPAYFIHEINQELKKNSVWFRANKPIDKTKFMIFRPRQKPQQMVFKILLDNSEIKQVNEIVFLGVILDEHGNLILITCQIRLPSQ